MTQDATIRIRDVQIQEMRNIGNSVSWISFDIEADHECNVIKEERVIAISTVVYRQEMTTAENVETVQLFMLRPPRV